MIRDAFISLCLMGLMASPAIAQTVQPQGTTLRVGGGAERIVAADGYEVTIFARRLGDVSAIARHDDGTLLTADRESGQIFRIRDRRMDGVADITQPLPHRFDRPTGLVVSGDIIFVADQGGLWRINPGGGTPSLIAPFANAQSTDDVHPITLINPTSILLGISRTDGTARLLLIDTDSGGAQLREEAPGRIIGFSSAANAADFPEPWLLMAKDDSTRFGSTLKSARNIDVQAQAIWIDAKTGRARLSLPSGVFETVATFAGLSDKGTPIVSGFNGVARPGAMISDERGLFIADQAGGRLWRLSETPEAETIVIVADPAAEGMTEDRPVDPAKDRSKRPELVRGSGIGRASSMGPASTMAPASTIPKADQPRAPSDPGVSDPSE